MESGFIESHIRRSNRNLVISGLVLLLIGGGLALVVGSWTHWMVAIIGISGTIVLGLWLKRVVNPSGHPVHERLARYGDALQLAQQVDKDFAGIKADASTRFGATWMAQGSYFGVVLVPMREIVWIYLHTQVTNGIASYSVRVYARDGEMFAPPGSHAPEPAQGQLGELRVRAPWAEVGYAPELEQQWQKERAKFLARVDARKEQYSEAST